MMQGLGFNAEESLTLCNAKKTVIRKRPHRTYEYEVPISWHDVKRLQDKGASNDEILAILV